jgi:regulator of cell morphogenesis and NO signaling
LFEKVVSVHGVRHPELLAVQDIFRQLYDDLAPHLLKEENILFPYILQMEAAGNGAQCETPPFVTVRNPVRMMLMEHEAAGELLRQVKTLTHDYTPPPDACISFRTLYLALENFEKDLHQHIHLENNILFPRAIEMEVLSTATLLADGPVLKR